MLTELFAEFTSLHPLAVHFPIVLLFVAPTVGFQANALEAHSGQATAVVNELAEYHDSLFANPEAAIDTSRLQELLKAAGDSEKMTAIFASALPLARKLGETTNAVDRLDAYAALVDRLREIVGHHDESQARLFYCPMAKKYWIAHGETPDMRTCGTRKK